MKAYEGRNDYPRYARARERSICTVPSYAFMRSRARTQDRQNHCLNFFGFASAGLRLMSV
jgi:hypothetical protein